MLLDTWVLMVSLLCTEEEENWDEEGMLEEYSTFSNLLSTCGDL